MNWFDVGYGLLLVVILVCVCAVLFLIPDVAIRLGLGGTLATAETKRLVLDGLTGGIPLRIYWLDLRLFDGNVARLPWGRLFLRR